MSLEIGDARDSPYGDALDDASGVLVASKNGAGAGFGAGFRGAQVASRGPWYRHVASFGAGDAAEHAPWWYQVWPGCGMGYELCVWTGCGCQV